MNQNNQPVPPADGRDAAAPNRPQNARPKEGGLTNWQKTMRTYYSKGLITCSNENHFRRERSNYYEEENYDEARRNAVPVMKTAYDILEMTPSYREAKCSCERWAMKQNWSANRIGVYQNAFVMPGSYIKGVGDYKPGDVVRRVFPIRFRISTPTFEAIRKRFPDWHLIQVANDGHDHPISHITTQIAGFELLQKLGRGNFVDLHGNPGANERFMETKPTTRIKTLVSLQTGKDYFRSKTKWGPEFAGERRRWTPIGDMRDLPRDHEADVVGVDAFISIHTGYYYSPSEIVRLLQKSPNATMQMIMHRFEGQNGSFNGGELKWEKDADGQITQTNAQTGESYHHPDNAMWFNSTSFATRSRDRCLASVPAPHLCREVVNNARVVTHCHDPLHGTFIPNPDRNVQDSLVWSLTTVCEEVYKVTVALCPSEALVMTGEDMHKPVTYMTSKDEVVRDAGVTIDTSNDKVFVPIRSEHVDLFDSMRSSACNKPRTEARFSAHAATCMTKANALFRDKGVDVAANELYAIQIASFWVDFKRDAYGNMKLVDDAQWLVNQHQLSLTGKTLLKNSNVLGLVLDIAVMGLRAKSGKDTAISVLEAIRVTSSKVI